MTARADWQETNVGERWKARMKGQYRKSRRKADMKSQIQIHELENQTDIDLVHITMSDF